MVTHYILISSSYSKGTRIALDICDIDDIEANIIPKITKEIQLQCGHDVSLGLQCIRVESEKWSDVVKADGFFDKMLVVKTLDEFIELINKDRELTAIDVALYILSKLKCSHIRLQKMLYFCYADYLCKTGEKLFNDKLIAYKYGPIVQSVYDVFKHKYGDLSEYGKQIPNKKSLIMPTKSKIFFTENGIGKAIDIDKTLERYKHYSGKALVCVTHRKGTPWDLTELGMEISDDDILKAHFIESKDRKTYVD